MHPIRLEGKSRRQFLTAWVFVVALVTLIGCGREPVGDEGDMAATEQPWPPQLPGYAEMVPPADNPMERDKVDLGHMLYYDQRLSGDGNRSCYGCHLEEHGLATDDKLAIGAFDKTLTRNIPTMWNVGYHDKWYWDGRATSLEAQVKGAWSTGNMGASGQDGAPSMEQVCSNLMEIPQYQEKFAAVFGEQGCTPDTVAQAVASFMRTIVSTDSPWVRFRNGDEEALSAEAREGYEIFANKAKCTNCHDGLLMMDMQFHNVGIGWVNGKMQDPGRAKVTNNEEDTGAFKTPTLIDVAESGPYFHDGSVATLEEAVHLMVQGGIDNPWIDKQNLIETKEALLTEEEEAKLVTFLEEVTAEYNIEEPDLP